MDSNSDSDSLGLDIEESVEKTAVSPSKKNILASNAKIVPIESEEKDEEDSIAELLPVVTTKSAKEENKMASKKKPGPKRGGKGKSKPRASKRPAKSSIGKKKKAKSQKKKTSHKVIKSLTSAIATQLMRALKTNLE